jgi:hypothetical protein
MYCTARRGKGEEGRRKKKGGEPGTSALRYGRKIATGGMERIFVNANLSLVIIEEQKQQ